MTDKPRITPASLAALAKGDVENFLVSSTPGGIEAQEKRGQQTLKAPLNDLLPIAGTIEPKTGLGGDKISPRPIWERLGFIFADKPQDALFISAKFPPGWKKVPTEHSMWSKLLDDKERERAMIFYKAAFYDRSAHVELSRRFSYGTDWSDEKAKERAMQVLDCGKAIHVVGSYANRDYASLDRLREEAQVWLNDHYPNWQDVTAYWEDRP